MQVSGILSLVPTVLLCLPSLIGGFVLGLNLLLQRQMEQLGQGASASIALAVMFGGPLVALSAMLCVVFAVSRRISVPVKFAHLLIVTAAAVCAVSLMLRFAS